MKKVIVWILVLGGLVSLWWADRSRFHNIHSPDPLNPFLFPLRKKGKGEPLINIESPRFGKLVKLKRDGTAVGVDLLSGAFVAPDRAHLKIEFWGDKSVGAERFNWKCRLSVPGGGLVETDKAFAFEAPDSGYIPSIDINMPASNDQWLPEVRRKFFIRLANGKYGRIEFNLIAFNGVFELKSSINPSGSRNLEPMDSKPPRRE